MELTKFFEEHTKVAIAFSGGADSAYLLYAAIKSGAEVKAYYVKSAFQPQFELEDASRSAKQLHLDMTVIETDVLRDARIAANPPDRCYYCKKRILSAIAKCAARDGFDTLLDGTNASDAASDRPGMRALKELNVLSPLRECGLTKAEIRRLSKDAGLFTWNKPAYACLATRIPAGEAITIDKLTITEQAENYLFALGFRDFRVRMAGSAAKLQVTSAQVNKVMKHREEIVRELRQHYSAVMLDLEVRDE